MKNTLMMAAVLGLLLNSIAGQPDEEGFVSVFNGQDLSGWIGATQSYAVENGILYAKPNKGGNLMLEKQYADFILRFDFLLPTNGNNGVVLRMQQIHGGGTLNGMGEIQILDDDGDQYKKLVDWASNGSLIGIAAAKRGFLKPVGEWNTKEIRAIGSRLTAVLNGTVILDIDVKDVKKTLDGREHPCLLNPKGYLGFMAHSSRVEFRNLRIKEIH